ncbi:hypothetical protein PoB_004454300 [Plakobranchus ocellatus]|uniref:Uncharacterized protein n=1 Tax=Plakobranchus ocellatus TaxID=259542 RepID=A0AAV4BEM4_9GAST|nr:hypothetical protein PoB_004454300 [Plakobranchus ocellatus]
MLPKPNEDCAGSVSDWTLLILFFIWLTREGTLKHIRSPPKDTLKFVGLLWRARHRMTHKACKSHIERAISASIMYREPRGANEKYSHRVFPVKPGHVSFTLPVSRCCWSDRQEIIQSRHGRSLPRHNSATASPYSRHSPATTRLSPATTPPLPLYIPITARHSPAIAPSQSCHGPSRPRHSPVTVLPRPVTAPP